MNVEYNMILEDGEVLVDFNYGIIEVVVVGFVLFLIGVVGDIILEGVGVLFRGVVVSRVVNNIVVEMVDLLMVICSFDILN